MTTTSDFFNIEFGTSQADIVAIATTHNANYIIVWTDHYSGNGKGYYQTVDNFAKSKVFSWNMELGDRGATSVSLVSGDVPSMVEEREQLVNKLHLLRMQLNKVYAEADTVVGRMIAIDGRLGDRNPKRLEAQAHNTKRKEWAENRRREITAEIEPVKALVSNYNCVSSTFIELFI